MGDVDLKIISQLKADSRTTLKAPSKITGYTSMDVKKRVDTLLREEALVVSSLAQ